MYHLRACAKQSSAYTNVLYSFSASPTPEKLNADILFLIDSSASVSNEDYRKEKDFVKSIAKFLNVSPGKSRAAVVTYGERPQLVSSFTSYRTLPEFESLVDRSPQIRGERRIDKVLEAAQSVLNNARKTAPKITVLLTAGTQYPAAGAKSLNEASQPLRDLGSKTFVIAIGSQPNQQELLPVVDQRPDIFSVISFDALRTQDRSIAKEIAKRPGRYRKLFILCIQSRVSMLTTHYYYHIRNNSITAERKLNPLKPVGTPFTCLRKNPQSKSFNLADYIGGNACFICKRKI